MSKHTPGPLSYKGGWIIKEGEGKDACKIAEVRGWGWLIHKHVHADGTSNHVEAAKEQDANGYLLAAAPELFHYAKLEEEYSYLCDRRRSDYSHDQLMEWIDANAIGNQPVGQWLGNIRSAAIAKAKGGTHENANG